MVPPVRRLHVVIPRILMLSGLALCGSVLRADVIYSNFGQNFGYANCCGVAVTNGTDLSVAIALPAMTSSYYLSDIQFIATSTAPDPSNSVSISVFADNNGIPGVTALETLTFNGQLYPFDTTVAPVLTLSSLTNPELLQGTTYWLVMDGLPNEGLFWGLNSNFTSGYLQTNGTPGNWQTNPNVNADATNGVFQIDGTLVTDTGTVSGAPEPGAWWLMAGGLGFAFVKARRRNQTGF